MTQRWMRVAPIAYGILWGAVPLFPAFITFTSVQFPGVSVVPQSVALGVFALMLLLGVWALPALFMLPRRSEPVANAIFLFVGACTLSSAIGLSPRDGLVFAAILALGAFWHYSQTRDYERPFVARSIYWSLMISGTIACVLAIGMVLTKIPAAQYTVANGRAVGTFVLPGELAGYVIVLLAVATGLVQTARELPLRIMAGMALVAGVVTMLLTFSRTGFVGLACAAGFYVAVRARSKRQGFFVAGAIVLAVVALVLMFFNERHNPSENYTRIAIWQAALGVIERFPLTGVGVFGFSHVYPAVRLPDGDEIAFHAHSMYLTFLAETGVLGFSAFVWVIVWFTRELRARLAQASSAATVLSLAIAAGVVGMLVQGLIDTVSVVIFGLFFPTLSLALVAAREGPGDA